MIPPRLLLRSLLVVTVSSAVALAAHAYRHSIQHDVEAGYRRDLRRLETLGAQVDRELLRSRAGLVMHYDSLTRAFRELVETTRRVRVPPPELGFDPGPELSDALARVEALLRDEEVLLDRFKSDNAILRNSRQYYPALLDELRDGLSGTPGSAPLLERLEGVVGALVHLDAAPAADAVGLLSAALLELELERAHASDVRDEVGLVSRHGRVIAQHHVAVDRLVANLLALPVASETARASTRYEQAYGAALSGAQIRISWLTGLIAAAVVLGLLEVIARARADARALREATGELEQANRALDRERQREQQLNELKTRFVSATSHEFRTPLTTILSSSQMLATYGERWDAERRMTHFERISTAAQHMTEMLEEILLIGRAEMGVLTPSPVALDLREFCASLAETLSRAAARQGSVDLTFSGVSTVELDRRLLSHVLGNLLENALKYSEPPSRVTLNVARERGGVRCVVRDSGVGIPEADLSRLYDSFYRGQNVGAIAGSGLGLAVVKRAVDVQAGTIDIQSEHGRGTTVSVWLPLAPSDDSDAEPQPVAPQLVEAKGAAPRSAEPTGPHAAEQTTDPTRMGRAAVESIPTGLGPPSRGRSAVKNA
jgi:signal transduction histidine kinase